MKAILEMEDAHRLITYQNATMMVEIVVQLENMKQGCIMKPRKMDKIQPTVIFVYDVDCHRLLRNLAENVHQTSCL